MNNRGDHASIDIQSLATSLRKEFEILHPLSKECCIYKVPQRIRQLNGGLYTPKVVSIGPFHHGREELKAMEQFKMRYLRYFLQRTKVSLEEFLLFIEDRETRLRNCYAETIELKSYDFLKMILLDFVFLIEFSLRKSIGPGQLDTSVDRIFTKPWKEINISSDLMLLENQLPLFIPKDLFDLAKREMHANIYEGLSVSKLTCDLWKGMGIDLLIEDKLLEKHFSEAEHFVDLITLCLQPSELGNQKGKLKTIVTRTVTELHQAAVKFKVGSSSHLLNIRFKYGTLEIPKLTLDDATEALLRNLQDFQGLNCESNYVNDYIAIMNYLVNGPKDAELLVQNGIIENWLSSSEDVSALFLNLQRETNIDDYNFTYAGLIDDLKAYCKSPLHGPPSLSSQLLFYSFSLSYKLFFPSSNSTIFALISLVLLDSCSLKNKSI